MNAADTNNTRNEDKDAKRRVISAGNPELDSKLGGGLPVGSLTLIEGSSGAGKSVLSQQILRGSLATGLTATLFTTENTVKSLVSQMQSIDLDILDYLLLGKFRVYPVELSQLGKQGPLALLQAMKQQRQDLIVIDSFTSAARASDAAHILSYFEECKRLCANGTSVVVIVHTHTVGEELIGSIRSICDAHLQLRSEQDGQRIVKTLEVAKVRGASSVTGAVVGFEVEPGWGMRVIPISKARG